MDWEAQESPGQPHAGNDGAQGHQEGAQEASGTPGDARPASGGLAARWHRTGRAPQAAAQRIALPIMSRPLINPRVAADPRLRVWTVRAAVSVLIYLAITVWFDWRIGLSVAVAYAAADTVYRSKTMAVIPPAVRVTSAQRSTRRRLSVLRAAGYLALHACQVPGTDSIIDHVLVGPAGIYTLDSERLDRRLPVRAIGGMLYHGPVSQEARIDHARDEAQHAANLIGAELGHPVRVRPVMIVYGPDVPWVIMRLKGVDVLDGSRVGTYFRRQSKSTVGHHLDTGQVAVIFAAAARAFRPIR